MSDSTTPPPALKMVHLEVDLPASALTTPHYGAIQWLNAQGQQVGPLEIYWTGPVPTPVNAASAKLELNLSPRPGAVSARLVLLPAMPAGSN